jgi:hypothetical protein
MIVYSPLIAMEGLPAPIPAIAAIEDISSGRIDSLPAGIGDIVACSCRSDQGDGYIIDACIANGWEYEL